MNGASRWARTEVVAQAATAQAAARRASQTRLLDRAHTLDATRNGRYEDRAEWSTRSVKQ